MDRYYGANGGHHMSEQECVDLMKSSQTQQHWADNCDTVKRACGGYPAYWYPAILASGLMSKIVARWGSDADLPVYGLDTLETILDLAG